MSPNIATARRMSMVWGVHAVQAHEVSDVTEMVEYACEMAASEGFGSSGDIIAITAGMPFGVSGTTNLLRIATL
jgi:pyruvate kinase